MELTQIPTSLFSSLLTGHLFVILIGLAPGLFWLWFFYRRDLEPEPIRLVATCFFVGALLCLPAGWSEIKIGSAIHWADPSLSEKARNVIDLTVIAPVTEEILKFLATLLILRCIKEFDEPLDGIIYGVSVALGFAALENIGYVNEASHANTAALTDTAIIRAVFSVPAHALFACLWGYALGYARFFKTGWAGFVYPLTGLILAIITHCLFNFAAMVAPVMGLALVVVVVVLWGMAEPRMAMLLLRSPHRTAPGYKERMRGLRERLALRRAEVKWYERKTVVLLLLFLVFAPAGLYGLFKTRAIATNMKWVYFSMWLGITTVATLHVK